MDIYQVVMLALLIFGVGMVVYTILRDSIGFNRMIGINHCNFNEADKKILVRNINAMAEEFVNGYTPNLKSRWMVKLHLIGLDGYDSGVQDMVDSLIFDESVGRIVVYSDRIVCFMDVTYLKKAWETKRAFWIEEGMVDRVEYYEGMAS